LQLVESEKLNISEISLIQVTEPFVAAIRERAESDGYPLEDLAHFLLIAAKLIALKARLLIPSPTEDEDEVTLVERLRAYQAFVNAGAWLRVRSEGGAMLFARGPHESVAVDVLPLAPTMLKIRDAMLAITRRQERPQPPTRAAVMQRLVTLEERMSDLKEAVAAGKTISFTRWIGEAPSREYAVVSFLALLELLRHHDVHVSQQDLFSDLEISSV
jgi:segregation and condensation protein A